MIFISGIAISFFLSALLLFKKNKSNADKILLVWFLLIAIHQLFFYFENSKYLNQFASLIGIDIPLPLIHGPFLFLYASALVNNLPQRKIFCLAHFLPAIFCYIYLTGFFSLPDEKKLFVMANNGIGFETFIKINYFAIIISGVVYVLWTLILLRKHQKKIKDNFSDIEKINLKWLQYLAYGIGIIWLTVIFGTDEQTFITIVIFVMVIGFFGIKQTPIFTTNNPPRELSFANEHIQLPVAPVAENLISEDVQKRYETSGLSQSKKQAIAEDLKKFVEDDKLFLNSDLSLDMLAEQLHIHPNYLSQFINEELALTFYDYINSKRVDEFKRIIYLPETSHFSMLGLALECGFNSKSSFNRNFKKFSGQTPTEYLNNLKR